MRIEVLRKRLSKLGLFCLIICLPLLLGAKSKANFDISGVKGKLLKNIQSRLTELDQQKPLSSQSDEELQQQIEQAMQPYGYFKPQIQLRRQPLKIAINPGPQMQVTSLSLSLIGEGANDPEIRKAADSLPIARGQPLNSAKYEEAKQNLMNAAERQGYLHSSFDKSEILINTTNYTAEIILLFNTGTQYYFGQVRFDPTYISPELLHRYVPFNYGQPYSTDQILILNNQLANSGYFRSISVKPQIGGDERHIPVDVHLQRASRISYSLGVGYGTDTGIRGRLGYHVVPVNRAGHKFNAVAIGSFGQSILQAQYIIPGKNPVTDQYHVTGNVSALDYNAGYSKSALISFSQHHSLPQYKRILSINSLYDGYHYYNQPDEENFTLYPKASFTWLKTKDKLFSPSGYSITVTGLGTSKLLSSHSNFIQASVNAKAALTVPSIRTRFYFHTLQGFTQINDINNLPLPLALLLGGADNLKAYSFNSIGPGKIVTYGGLEIQKETIEHWYFVGFLDSGDVYKPNLKKLRNDIGVGLMWVSPIGPIKIGIAQGVDTHFNRQGKSPKLVVSMGPDLS
ncbi:Autotransporter assembly factor TamA [Legionella massiliensis]|uniref:Translocation and assembly module subunit TamA n=1 Tax=Legionella massiliensis TaxID=1034943 RepID=A0A078KVS5_9GAMM|nr:POTRA domain-containing protein [Legionella massiliensis]CDZ78535.1 Autotransporter assembly factor TamA [Legionella massiliensis]CEE14273.1 Translocation and assembly module TamA precursor [Legionella massiliensis]